MIVAFEIRLPEAPFDARAERFGGVAGDFAPEQVARHRHVEVRLALQKGQVDDAELADGRDVKRVFDPALAIAAQVASIMRCTPVSPTNI